MLAISNINQAVFAKINAALTENSLTKLFYGPEGTEFKPDFRTNRIKPEVPDIFCTLRLNIKNTLETINLSNWFNFNLILRAL